jgi:uncharacterized protein YndB with AHSA1/START domain
MTTLTNQITIAAPRRAVWAALTTLDLLEQYDPGVRSSTLVGDPRAGLGAQRRCDLRPAGWFIEHVALWQPDQALAFELVTCSLPVQSLRHHYTLTHTRDNADGHVNHQTADQSRAGTVVTQVMTYTLKYGLAGQALDAVVMRRQWDRGIKGFLHGLQQYVQTQHATTTPE